jgi:RNA polymerase sigma factor (sigma-70 family)
MERALVDRAKKGDTEAYDAIVRMIGGQCLAIASRILRDRYLAEEAVQVALIRAWRDLRGLRDPGRFEAWLHRILTNACYLEAKRSHRWQTDVRVVQLEPSYYPTEILGIHERDELERAFRQLTVEQRAVLVFRYYLELSVPEVAERLSIPTGTVKSRLHYALAALRAGLEADARIPIPEERPA